MKKRYKIYFLSTLIFTLGVSVVFLTACRKECCNDLIALTVPIALATDTVSDITHTSAQCGGSISSDGGAAITACGVCWSTAQTPTVADSISSDSSGIGSFTSLLTGLIADTSYYVRAYAINSSDTAYGNERTFITLTQPLIPDLTTTQITNITQTTATSGGNITSDGGSPVTERGVCWSTSANPTTADNKTSDGTGTGAFTSNITGLTANTSYYVRAYATNTVGTAYGNEVGALTVADGSACPNTPTVSYGGKVYNTVMIGAQCWMSENLNIGTRIDGSQEQTNNNPDYIEKYCYNDLSIECDEYGGLYQWGEMVRYLNGASNTTTWNPVPTGHVQGICPPDWHLPKDTEWEAIVIYLGGWLDAGGPMKETGTAHWLPPNTGATNSSGFTALPGGSRRINGSFDEIGNFCSNWSSTEYTSMSGVIYDLYAGNDEVSEGGGLKSFGLSVRCVKD